MKFTFLLSDTQALKLLLINMSTSTFAALDQIELIQLALNAGKNNESGLALSYLKEAVSRPDATGVSHFLLGSEYAQIQMYERAIAEMESAFALDPSLLIARFQLGLLLLSMGDGVRAIEVLSQLEDIEQNNPLYSFGRGLIYLIKDDFTNALQNLNEGIVLNKNNFALNNDMQKIVDEINKLQLTETELDSTTLVADGSASRHIFISAYTGNDHT